jgi:hypothetical protein
MGHKPRGLVLDTKHSVNLVAAHAFLAGTNLAGTKQVYSKNPLVKRYMASLE